jgi:CRISPR-associated protein Cmr3
MTWIFIQPTDVWFFRNAKPYAAGEGHTARSFFPPSPATITGALRSLVLGASHVAWKDYKNNNGTGVADIVEQIGTPANLGKQFKVKGPFLARRLVDGKIERLYPLPADAYVPEPEHDLYTFDTYKPSQTRKIIADSNWATTLHPLWPPTNSQVTGVEENCWMTDASLKEYLDGHLFGGLAEHNLFIPEPRLGITLDYNHRRPEQQMLYNAWFTRARDDEDCDTGLLVWLDGFDLPADAGWLALGGEARSGHYRVVAAENVTIPESMDEGQTKIKLLLLTPAYFNSGWQPVDGDWEKIWGQPAKLISVALGRPLHLGGWNMANDQHKHKAMWAYVPPGSVYYFELEKPLQKPIKAFTQLPQEESEFSWFINPEKQPYVIPLDRMGFGQAVLGKWDWLENQSTSSGG